MENKEYVRRMVMTDRAIYLDWVNNFLTVARFAEYYSMTENAARRLIEKEREKEWGDSDILYK